MFGLSSPLHLRPPIPQTEDFDPLWAGGGVTFADARDAALRKLRPKSPLLVKPPIPEASEVPPLPSARYLDLAGPEAWRFWAMPQEPEEVRLHMPRTLLMTGGSTDSCKSASRRSTPVTRSRFTFPSDREYR